MNSLQATDDKHLILEDQFEGQADAERPPLHSDRQHNFWANRYLCIYGNHDKKFWRFDIFDLLTNDSKSVRFQKSSNQFQDVKTHFLDYKFMLTVESADSVNLYCVTLVKLNWKSGVFEKLEHFEQKALLLYIIVDSSNQMKFVLVAATWSTGIIDYQNCKLVNGRIEFGSVYRLSNVYNQCSSDKLIGICNRNQKLRIKTYNMIDKQERSFETDACPGHANFGQFQWIVDRLYAAIYFRDSGNYGLMWTDAETRRWNILSFLTNMPIWGLHFSNDTLIIYTKEFGKENGIFKSSVKVYGIAIHRPQPLRQKAWLRVICSLKAEGNPDPYKEAARYLPFNSDLRPHWFDDVGDETSDKQNEDSEKNDSDGTNGESETSQDNEESDGDEEVPFKRLKPN